jgi:hypothetical protein
MAWAVSLSIDKQDSHIIISGGRPDSFFQAASSDAKCVLRLSFERMNVQENVIVAALPTVVEAEQDPVQAKRFSVAFHSFAFLFHQVVWPEVAAARGAVSLHDSTLRTRDRQSQSRGRPIRDL